MISITPEAADQVRVSAKQGDTKNMPLRIAVTRLDDGSLHYALGFDDNVHEDDKTFKSEGIELIVGSASMDMLSGTVIDYVELDSGQKEIIFINPNDAAQQTAE